MKTKYILIGQTKTGEIISEEKCKEILNLPISEIHEKQNTNYNSNFEMEYTENLDFKIDKNKIIEDYIFSKVGSFAYEIEKLKMLAGRKKSALELNLNDLKTEIETMKKQLNSKNSDRLEELKLTKQLKLKQKELLKKEEGLFFDKAQIDADTEQEIQELTDKKRFRVNIECYFKLNYSCKRD